MGIDHFDQEVEVKESSESHGSDAIMPLPKTLGNPKMEMQVPILMGQKRNKFA
jgi:hypothetical protein